MYFCQVAVQAHIVYFPEGVQLQTKAVTLPFVLKVLVETVKVKLSSYFHCQKTLFPPTECIKKMALFRQS
jgi:hypothetical protein